MPTMSTGEYVPDGSPAAEADAAMIGVHLAAMLRRHTKAERVAYLAGIRKIDGPQVADALKKAYVAAIEARKAGHA